MSDEARRARLLGRSAPAVAVVDPVVEPVVEVAPAPTVASKRDRLLGRKVESVVAAKPAPVPAVARTPVAAPVAAPVVVVKKGGAKPKVVAPYEGDPAMPWGYYEQIDTGATPEAAQAYVDALPTFGTVGAPGTPTGPVYGPPEREMERAALPKPSKKDVLAANVPLNPKTPHSFSSLVGGNLVSKGVAALEQPFTPKQTPETLVSRAALRSDVRGRAEKVINEVGFRNAMGVSEDAPLEDLGIALVNASDPEFERYYRYRLSKADARRPEGQKLADLPEGHPERLKVKEDAMTDIASLQTVGMWGPKGLMPADRDPTSVIDALKPTAEVIGVNDQGALVTRVQSLPSLALEGMSAIEYGIVSTGLPSALLRGMFGDNPEAEQPTYDYGQIAGITVPFSPESIRSRRDFLGAKKEADVEGTARRLYRSAGEAVGAPAPLVDAAEYVAGNAYSFNVGTSAFVASLLTIDPITATMKGAKLAGAPFLMSKTEKLARAEKLALRVADDSAKEAADFADLIARNAPESEVVERLEKAASAADDMVKPLTQSAKDAVADAARVRVHAEKAAVEAQQAQGVLYSERGDGPLPSRTPAAAPDVTAPIVLRNKGERAGAEGIDRLSAAGKLYRGMTEAEYVATVGKDGHVRSRQDYSAPGEGTSFSDSFADAESYVDFGRDDPRITGRPNYIVEVDRGELSPSSDGYFKAPVPVPAGRVWKVVAEDDSLVGQPLYSRAAPARAAEYRGVDGKPRTATLFSGGGLVEVGLRGKIDPVLAVEANADIGAAYKVAHGDHVRIDDVRNVDIGEAGDIDYLHASPVCKNFSEAKVVTEAGEQPLDIETAKATADAIRKAKPRVFTLENVAGYQDSEATKLIEDALRAEGYTFDARVYDAADYGSATRRKRFLIRAVKDGPLPFPPTPTHGAGLTGKPYADWYATVADLVDGLPDETPVPPWARDRLAKRGIDAAHPDRPIIVMGGSAGGTTVPYAFEGGPAPTFKATPGELHRIVLPDGRVKRVTPQVMARITGLPDDYPLPANRALATTIIGNGVPPALSEAVFAPLLAGGRVPGSAPEVPYSRPPGNQTDTPAFRAFIEGTKAVDESGAAKRLYHGTTHEFDAFDAKGGNVENHHGRGIYLTSSADDVGANYATREGPDIKSRIAGRHEEMVDVWDDPDEAGALVDEWAVAHPERKADADVLRAAVDDPASVAAGPRLLDEVTLWKAEQQIAGSHGGAVLPVYAAIKNPVDLRAGKVTRFDIETKWSEDGEDVLGEEGLGVQAKEAIQSVANDYGDSNLADEVIAALDDPDGFTAADLEQAVRRIGSDWYVDGERSSPGQFLQDVYRELGFDGIVISADKEFGAGRKFGRSMPGINPDTEHWVAFEPTQVKSATGNRGTFDPKDKRLLYQTVSVRKGEETLAKFGLPPRKKKYTTREVAAALEARQRKKYGLIDAKDQSPTARRKIAKWMAEEVAFEKAQAGRSGAGWYSEKYQKAMDSMAEEFPELANDLDAKTIFTALVAVTSDGNKVMPNMRMAADIYDNFRKTGKFSTPIGHVRQASIDKSLAVIQELHDSGGPPAFRRLLDEITVGEYNKLARATGKKKIAGELVNARIPTAASLFGPKLGAFYANLMGADGYLTMDRWWSRTFNRYRGTLLERPTREGLDRMKALLGDPSMTDDAVLSATVPLRKSYEAKGFKDGTEAEVAANTVWKAAFDELADAPAGGSDRKFMREAAKEAQAILKKQGMPTSVADIQAILWYYEKRLYGELGARETADIAFDEAARRVVAERRGRAGSSGRALGPDGSAAGDDVAEGVGDVHTFDPGDDLFEVVGTAAPIKVGYRGKTIGEAEDAIEATFATRAEAEAAVKEGGPLEGFEVWADWTPTPGKTTDVLAGVVADGGDEALSAVAKHLIETRGDDLAGVVVRTDADLPSQAVGRYNPAARVIDLAETATPKTVVHEAMHVVTHDAITNPHLYSPAVQKAVRNLEQLHGLVRRIPGIEDMGRIYGLKNTDEFVAEAMSSPEFQSLLREVKVTVKDGEIVLGTGGGSSRSLWDSFVSTMAKILGFSDTDALGHVLSNTQTIIRETGGAKTVILAADTSPWATKIREAALAVKAKSPTTDFAWLVEHPSVGGATKEVEAYKAALAEAGMDPRVVPDIEGVVGKSDDFLYAPPSTPPGAAKPGAAPPQRPPPPRPVQYSATPMRGTLDGALKAETAARVRRSSGQHATLGLSEGLRRVATLATSKGGKPAVLTPAEAAAYAERLFDSASTTARELALGAQEAIAPAGSKGAIRALVESVMAAPPTPATQALVSAVEAADAARRMFTGERLEKALRAVTPRVDKAFREVMQAGVAVTPAQRAAFRDAAVLELEGTLIGKNSLARAQTAIDKVLATAPVDQITPQMMGDVDEVMRTYATEAAEATRRANPLRSSAPSILLGESASRFRGVKDNPTLLRGLKNGLVRAAKLVFVGGNEMAPWAKEGLSKEAREWTLAAVRRFDAIAGDVSQLKSADEAAAYLHGVAAPANRGLVTDGMDRFDVFTNLVTVDRQSVDEYLDALMATEMKPKNLAEQINGAGVAGRPEQAGAKFPFWTAFEAALEAARAGKIDAAGFMERLHKVATPYTRNGEVPEAWTRITTGWIAAQAENVVLLNKGFGDGIVFTRQDVDAIRALGDGKFDSDTMRALDPANMVERAVSSNQMVGVGGLEGRTEKVGELTVQIGGADAVAGARKHARAAERIGVYNAVMADQIYVPRLVREQMAGAIARTFTPQTYGGNNMLGVWKLANTRGVLASKPGYILNNMPGDTEQIMIATGMRVALKTAVRAEGASVASILVTALPSMAGHAARAAVGDVAGPVVQSVVQGGVDFGLGVFLAATAGKNKGAVARLIHAGGEVGEKLAGKVANMLGMGATRVEISTIMDGGDELVTIGDKVWKARELRRTAIETGVYDSFDRAELVQSVNGLNKLFRVPAEGVSSIAETVSLRKRLALYTVLIEEGMQPKVAGRAVVDALFDYRATLSEGEQHWLRQVLLPFWSWQKNMNRLVINSVASPMGAYRLKVTHQVGDKAREMMAEAPTTEGDDVGILNTFMLADEVVHYERFRRFRELAEAINPKLTPENWNAIILSSNPAVPVTTEWTKDPTIPEADWLTPRDVEVMRAYLSPWYSEAMARSYLRDRAQVRMKHPVTPDGKAVPTVTWHAVAPRSGLAGAMEWFSMVTAGTLASAALGLKTVGVPATDQLSMTTPGEALAPTIDPRSSPVLGSMIAALDPAGRSPQRVAEVIPKTVGAIRDSVAGFLWRSGVADGDWENATPGVLIDDKSGTVRYTYTPEIAALIGSLPGIADLNRKALSYEGSKGEAYAPDVARILLQSFGFSTPTVENMAGLKEVSERDAWVRKQLPQYNISRGADGERLITTEAAPK